MSFGSLLKAKRILDKAEAGSESSDVEESDSEDEMPEVHSKSGQTGDRRKAAARAHKHA